MVNNGETPMDTEFHIPLPIYPAHNLPKRLLISEPNIERIADDHHPNHPGPALVGTVDGNAVRHALVQWVSYTSHHYETEGYHAFCDSGPQIPVDRSGRFGHTLLQVAGFIAPNALEFKSGKMSIVPLSSTRRQIMRDRGDFKVSSLDAVKTFWLEHLLEQLDTRPDDIDDDKIENFRTVRSSSPYLRPMGSLITHLADLAAEPHRKLYETAHARNLLTPGIRGNPVKFIKGVVLAKGQNSTRAKVQQAVAKYRRGEVVVPFASVDAVTELQNRRIPA